VERAADKDLAAGGPMGDLQLLIQAKKVDRVGSCNGAAPQGVDADLLFRPFTGVALPTVDRGVFPGGIDG